MIAPGRVFWITGLSGAGKTTVGEKLWRRLRAEGSPALFLDGDKLRETIAEDLGRLLEDRRRSAMRNARLCRLLSDQGVDVVCATISLFHEVQAWNREHIPGYQEIHLKVPLAEIERRDPKGFYAGGRDGTGGDIVGIDVVAEEPLAPDLLIENHGALDADAAVDLIWDGLVAADRPPPAQRGSARFGTKAETLAWLAPQLTHAGVLPQVRFCIDQWRSDPAAILEELRRAPWSGEPLIVRSSARGEDGAAASAAGKYKSITDVQGEEAFGQAVERIVASYGEAAAGDDQVFVQPMLADVAMAGVAFTRDPNSGGPYLVINYDDVSGRTDLVTSGAAGELKTFFCLKSERGVAPPPLQPVVELLEELETVLAWDALDIEFAIDGDGRLWLLQVRPLTGVAPAVASALVDAAAADIARKVELLSRPHPYLHGRRSVFGVMPDWNPAEMIGLRPKPLSLTMYQDLITDAIWAYQRDNYGYQNLRSFPLMVSFHGLPYIDVRVSFNSFVPRDVEDPLAERLVNYYVDRLLEQPSLHDKVEFEIIFSCYTLDLPHRIGILGHHGFSGEDIDAVSEALRGLTNRIIHGETGLWRQDRDKIDILVERLGVIGAAPIDKISRIYWLLEDCKRYGTLPFAGLARAGFIAIQLLRSLVTTNVLEESEYGAFLANLETVGSRIGRDFAAQSRTDFLARYGHLRPGAYDILSPRYDEAPDLYFDWTAPPPSEAEMPRFALSVPQLRRIEALLREHRLEHDVLGLMEFIKAGIEGREFAKFVFTRSLSDALSLIRQLGAEHGIDAEDCAFLDLAAVRALYHESGSVAARLRDSVRQGKERHALTRSIVLPPLLTSPQEVFSFHLPATEPNFITQKSVTAPTSSITDPPESFAGKILFIPSADPGYDWIFSRGIQGFVTQFGGVNSHMAIRAGELGMPAAIGSGEALFQRWRTARKICLDCGNRQVRLVA